MQEWFSSFYGAPGLTLWSYVAHQDSFQIWNSWFLNRSRYFVILLYTFQYVSHVLQIKKYRYFFLEAKTLTEKSVCVEQCVGKGLCDADYVGYTRQHLFQRIVEHKHSAIGKHLRDSHNQENKDHTEHFTILKKCRRKFECLIYEMLFIQEKKPKLNTQSDSIKAKTHYIPHCSF